MNQQKRIDQIHSEFDTAQERLLFQANEILSKEVDLPESPIESIAKRLKNVGFINVPVASQADLIKGEKEKLKNILVQTKKEAETIKYYQEYYPFLKFLTESELDRICKKYNLVYASVSKYNKDVPEKNLTDIESAQEIKCGDSPESINFFSGEIWCSYDYPDLQILLKQKCRNLKKVRFNRIEKKEGVYIGEDSRDAMGVLKSLNIKIEDDKRYIWIKGEIETLERSGLFIAAPESHFNTDGLTKKGLGLFEVFKKEVKDPIVFRYVRGGVQVITKWGLEANDPALVVPKLN